MWIPVLVGKHGGAEWNSDEIRLNTESEQYNKLKVEKG